MLPDFVIIGAAKAGTTALYWYLDAHPDVYMSPMKETNFFAYALDEDGSLSYGDPELHKFRVTDLATYERLFEGRGTESALGEASPIYLEAPGAADRIRQLVPHMKIICGLRDPVDRAYSDYLMYLRNRGRRFDPETDLASGAAWTLPDSHWMSLGFYHAQLQRYFAAFDRDQIMVYLFDDLRSDAVSVVSGIYDFIGVDPGFRPDMDTPHNVGGVPKRMGLERLLTDKRMRRILDPLVPRRFVDRMRRLRTANLDRAPALPPELRREMAAHFETDLRQTGQLIGRDLGLWMESAEAGDSSAPPRD